MMARELGIDPVEFRRKNLLREGRPQATGTVMQGRGDREGARAARRRAWTGTKPFDRGTGDACGAAAASPSASRPCVAPTTSLAVVNVNADGSCTLYCSTVDMGQGSDTAMAQIAGEVLDMPAESVRSCTRDTDVTPYDMATLGSRSLFHMGNAVRLAAEDARDKVAALAARAESAGRQQCSARRSVSARNTACRLAMSSAPAAYKPELQAAGSRPD